MVLLKLETLAIETQRCTAGARMICFFHGWAPGAPGVHRPSKCHLEAGWSRCTDTYIILYNTHHSSSNVSIDL